MQQYCDASGQQINTDKSSIHFAKKCQQSVRDGIKGVLNVQNECLSKKYLEMPSDVGSATNGAFKYLKDRIWNKVQGWMEQSGGKCSSSPWLKQYPPIQGHVLSFGELYASTSTAY